jgi:hypothetical protein
MTSPTATVTPNFDGAIAAYSDAARKAFDDARLLVPARSITKESAESELLAAFTQLSSAALMQDQERSRAGLDAVVALMQTTADAAAKVSDRLVTLLLAAPSDPNQPQTVDFTLVDELKATLDVLARLSPSAVWTASGNSSANPS